MELEDMEDAALALEDVEVFLGNWWPEHPVNGAGMAALIEAHEKVKAARKAVWALEHEITYEALVRVMGEKHK